MMNKKYFLTFLLLCLQVVCFGQFGEIIFNNGNLVYTVIPGTQNVKVQQSSSLATLGDLTIHSNISNGEQNYTVTVIKSLAFDSNATLTSVTVPSTITNIENLVFYGCYNLTAVTINKTLPPNVGNSFSGPGDLDNVTLRVPSGALSNYINVYPWSDFRTIEELPAPCTTPAPPSADAQTFCGSATVANLVVNAMEVNVVPQAIPPSPVIKWYSQSTGDNELSNSTQLTTGNYYVSQTINGCESARTQVAVTVNAVPAVPGDTTNSITVSIAGNFCTIAGTYSFTNQENGKNVYLLSQGFVTRKIFYTGTKWVAQSTTPGGTSIQFENSNVTTSLIPPTTGWTAAISGCSESTMTITLPPVTLSLCGPSTVNDLTILDETIKWYATAASTSPLAGTASVSTGSYWATQTVNGCESAKTEFAVTVNAVPTIIEPTPGSACFGNMVTISAIQSAGAIRWYTTETGGEPLTSSGPYSISGNSLSINDFILTTNYWVEAVNGDCVSATRTMVTATLNPSPTIEDLGIITICTGSTAVIAPEINLNDNLTLRGGAENTYQWFTKEGTIVGNDNGPSVTVSQSGTYFLTVTNNNGCTAEQSFNVIVNPLPAAPAATSPQNFTFAATVADLVPSIGEGIRWYDSADASEPLASDAEVSTGTYYVSQTNANGCESPKTAVEVTVSTCTPPTLGTVTAAAACVGSSTNVVLSGMLSSTFGVATYTVNDGLEQTASGTSSPDGTFSFSTVALPIEADGYVVRIKKLTTLDGCETLFENKMVTLVVNEYPTLGDVIIAPGCAGSTTTVTLTGLLANTNGTATYKLGPFPEVVVNGTSDAQGNFIFTTPVLTPAANNLVVSIVNLTTDGGCSTLFTNKKATVKVLAKPTLGSMSTSTVCAGSPATINLTGLLQNSSGTVTYKVGNNPTQTATGTSTAQGTFSFVTPDLPASANGLVVEITKIETDLACFTNFTGKKVTLQVTEGPTLTEVTSAYVCVNGTNKLKVVLSGLKPSTYHKIDFTRDGAAKVRANPKSTAAGKITIELGPAATLNDNGKVVNITKLTNNATLCETNFTDKSVTLATGTCATRGTTTKEEAIAEDLTANLVTLYPNPTRDILNIDSANEIKSVEILNMQGQRMLTASQKQINVSSLPAGTYMVRIQDAQNNVTTKRVIKN